MVTKAELLAELDKIRQEEERVKEIQRKQVEELDRQRKAEAKRRAENIMDWLGPVLKDNVASRALRLGVYYTEKRPKSGSGWDHIAGIGGLGFSPTENAENTKIVTDILTGLGFEVSLEDYTSRNFSYDGDGNSYDTDGYHTDYYMVVKW